MAFFFLSLFIFVSPLCLSGRFFETERETMSHNRLLLPMKAKFVDQRWFDPSRSERADWQRVGGDPAVAKTATPDPSASGEEFKTE